MGTGHFRFLIFDFRSERTSHELKVEGFWVLISGSRAASGLEQRAELPALTVRVWRREGVVGRDS
jgi:hypothetical protein